MGYRNMLTRRTGTITLAAGLATFLAACQSGTVVDNRSTSSPAAQARVVMDYQLGSGDQIKVTVFGHEDLSGQFEIDGSGAISMPLIGQISAIGQTTQSLEQAITVKLSDGYLLDPSVSAEVINYRPFFILGEISRPGEYPYASGLTVLNAVAAAGGFSYRANKKAVFIKAFEGEKEVAYQLNAQVMVQPGDTIRIGERIF